MPSDITTFIKLLQTSKLYAECPSCGEKFFLAKSLLFDGMKNNKMKNVVFLSKSTPSKYLQVLQQGASKAINNKAYDWKVVRVSQDGQVEIE